MIVRCLAALALALLVGGLHVVVLAAEEPLFNDAGYRSRLYRAALSEQPPEGVVKVDTERVQALRAAGASLIDTTPLERTAETDFSGLWLQNKPRWHIPGSVWLPNIGYGTLDDAIQAYFRRHLQALSQGRPEHPLVFYCIIDCWMSWNAARRAAADGYQAVYWYPGGSDDWQDAGHALVEGAPVPLFESAP
ncbi:MAG: rhodanese-like domain-containing protein [Geminicoccaceae bacterium]